MSLTLRLAATLPLAPALTLVATWCIATTVGPTSDTTVNDLFVYETYARLLADGTWPYSSGFPLEYPPLALVPIGAASVAGTTEPAYAIAFGAAMLLIALIVMALTVALARDGARTAREQDDDPARAPPDAGLVVAWLIAISPLLTGAMVRTHFDLLPLALLLGALLAIARGHELPGFGLLGAGAMAKVFPVVLVPIAGAWLLARGRPRAALLGVAVFLAVVAVVSLPFLGEGYLDAYRFHLDRPVQIESTPATVLFAIGGSDVTGAPIRPDPYKSNGLDGGAAGPVAALFVALELLAIALAVVRAAMVPTTRGLVLAAFAALLAFAALGKVLSPQFLIWLVPFAALAWAWRMRALALVSAAAILLTQIEFPGHYFDLVDRDGAVIALVATRNALLLVALALLLSRTLPRWPRPALRRS